MTRKNKLIVIVGAGGIGSNLFQDLTRYAPEKYKILLIDGDIVEKKNILRQMFTSNDIGINKAEALTSKANNTLLLRNWAYSNYIPTEEEKGAELLLELTKDYNEIILFGALDNHSARRQLEKFFKSFTKKMLYIDAANEKDIGDVVVCYREYDEIAGCLRSDYDYSVMLDNDNDPNKKSCSSFLDNGDTQTLIANRKAAVLSLEIFHNYLYDNVLTGVWRFNSCVTHQN